MIEVTLQEELAEVLGSGWYERREVRRGYRNGRPERAVTMLAGPRRLRIPRARLLDGAGATREFRSALLPRYARRTRDLAGETYAFLFLDGFHLKLRMARRVFSVPVLAVLGVDADGAKVLVSLRLAASEASGRWSGSCLTSRSGASRRRS